MPREVSSEENMGLERDNCQDWFRSMTTYIDLLYRCPPAEGLGVLTPQQYHEQLSAA